MPIKVSDGLRIHPLRSRVVRTAVRPVDASRAALGIRSPLRDLRHTSASLLLAATVNARLISARLGHSTVAFTLDTYAHLLPDADAEAVEALVTMLGNRHRQCLRDLEVNARTRLATPSQDSTPRLAKRSSKVYIACERAPSLAISNVIGANFGHDNDRLGAV